MVTRERSDRGRRGSCLEPAVKTNENSKLPTCAWEASAAGRKWRRNVLESRETRMKMAGLPRCLAAQPGGHRRFLRRRYRLGWEGEPAPAIRCRARGLLAFDQRAHGEHVERIAARRMHLADQNRAHQFMVGLAEKCAMAIEREIRRQCVSLQRTGEDDRIERFFLIGDLRQRAD